MRPRVKTLTTPRAVTSVRALHMRWPRDKNFPAPTHSARRFHFILQPLFGGGVGLEIDRPVEPQLAGMEIRISAVAKVWSRPLRAIRKGSSRFSGGLLAVRKRSFGYRDQRLANRPRSFRPGRTPLRERKDLPRFSREPFSVLKTSSGSRNVRLSVPQSPFNRLKHRNLTQKAASLWPVGQSCRFARTAGSPAERRERGRTSLRSFSQNGRTSRSALPRKTTP